MLANVSALGKYLNLDDFIFSQSHFPNTGVQKTDKNNKPKGNESKK